MKRKRTNQRFKRKTKYSNRYREVWRKNEEKEKQGVEGKKKTGEVDVKKEENKEHKKKSE